MDVPCQDDNIKIKRARFKAALFMVCSALLLGVFLLLTGRGVFVVDGAGEKEKHITLDRTEEGFMEEFIAGTDLRLEPRDSLLPEGKGELQPGGGVDVVEPRRGRVEYLHLREPIPFKQLRISNSSLDRGIVHTVQEGEEGEKETILAVVEQEDGAVSRYVVSQRVIREPVPRILEYGGNTLLSRGGKDFEFVRAFYVEATAYCPGTPGSGCPLDERGHSRCTGPFNDGYTYSGARALAGDGSLENPHIIAVDPAVIPLRSLVYLEGYGFALALDRGGAIQGLRLDLLYDHHADAVQFGRRQVKVYLFPRQDL